MGAAALPPGCGRWATSRFVEASRLACRRCRQAKGIGSQLLTPACPTRADRRAVRATSLPPGPRWSGLGGSPRPAGQPGDAVGHQRPDSGSCRSRCGLSKFQWHRSPVLRSGAPRTLVSASFNFTGVVDAAQREFAAHLAQRISPRRRSCAPRSTPRGRPRWRTGRPGAGGCRAPARPGADDARRDRERDLAAMNRRSVQLGVPSSGPKRRAAGVAVPTLHPGCTAVRGVEAVAHRLGAGGQRGPAAAAASRVRFIAGLCAYRNSRRFWISRRMLSGMPAGRRPCPTGCAWWSRSRRRRPRA